MNFIARKLLWQASMGQVKAETKAETERETEREGRWSLTKDDGDGGRVHTHSDCEKLCDGRTS